MSNMTKQQYTAKFDFVGDANLHQLSFGRGTAIDVNVEQKPKNGWLWGSCFGRKGWFPAWSIEYDETLWQKGQGGPSGSGVMGTVDEETRRALPEQNELNPSTADESSGFDPTDNEIMGGRIPQQREERNDEGNEWDTSFKSPSAFDDNRKSEARTTKGFFGKFRKSKINPFPFQHERPKTPEWTPEPQIIYEGKVIRDFSQSKKKGLFHFNKD